MQTEWKRVEDGLPEEIRMRALKKLDERCTRFRATPEQMAAEWHYSPWINNLQYLCAKVKGNGIMSAAVFTEEEAKALCDHHNRDLPEPPTDERRMA